MNSNFCVCCGAEIPEGRQVCWSCERGGVRHGSKSPSDRQMEFADQIAYTLGVDFPKSSKDFTASRYWKFISEHVDEAKEVWDADPSYDDDEMAWFSPINQ